MTRFVLVSPIQNIIFDFYGVLYYEDIEGFILDLINSKNYTQEQVSKLQPLNHFRPKNDQDWRQFATHLETTTGLQFERDDWAGRIWGKYTKPFSYSLSLLQKMRVLGLNAYYLTNIHQDNFVLRQEDELYKYFRGGLASCEANMRKPDSLIFQLLLSKYNLDPKCTLFLDDRAENISAAAEFGIKGILVKPNETNLEAEILNWL
jgi:FMN phosphatase YigB (HAD superfamily)